MADKIKRLNKILNKKGLKGTQNIKNTLFVSLDKRIKLS